MATYASPYMDVGVAAFEELDTYVQSYLISGSHPVLAAAISQKVKTGVTLKKFQVVGYDENNLLVPAVKGTVQAAGIVTEAIVGTGEPGNETKIPTWYSGCFEPSALAWDESYATDEDKATAFVGAPTPTTIAIRKRL